MSGQLGDPVTVEVVALVVQGHRHVQGIARHHDVRRPRVPDHAVEGRVGLDHPATRLSLQTGEETRLRLAQPVDPGRQLSQRAGQGGRPVHQREADLLHPRRPALGPGADDDVAVTEGEPAPAVAVLVRGGVAARGRHPAARALRTARWSRWAGTGIAARFVTTATVTWVRASYVVIADHP